MRGMTAPCNASSPSSPPRSCSWASSSSSSSRRRPPRTPARGRPRTGRQSAPATTAAASTARAATAPPAVRLQKLPFTFDQPVYVTSPPGDTSRLFVVEKTGRIRVIKNGALLTTPFLDISSLVSTGGEQGLLSMAFDPHYATNGRFYVDYTNVNGDTRVVRYRVSSVEPGRGRSPRSARTILGVAPALLQPQRRAAAVRPRRAPLRGHGRRRQRRRPAASRAGPAQPAGQAPAHQRRRLAGQGDDLRQGAAQPVALLVRPQDRRAVDRRRRPGRLGGDRLSPAGTRRPAPTWAGTATRARTSTTHRWRRR